VKFNSIGASTILYPSLLMMDNTSISNENLSISLLLPQIIGLLNVFTPQKSLEEFQDV